MVNCEKDKKGCWVDCARRIIIIVKGKNSNILKAHFSPKVTRSMLKVITKENIGIVEGIEIKTVIIDVKRNGNDKRIGVNTRSLLTK